MSLSPDPTDPRLRRRGNADFVARLVGQKLQASLKQSVIVDIKASAGGLIATSFVAKTYARSRCSPPGQGTEVLLRNAPRLLGKHREFGRADHAEAMRETAQNEIA